jgi:hypothetical protein
LVYLAPFGRLAHSVERLVYTEKAAGSNPAPSTILTKVETGVIKKPSVFVMAKLAKTLGVSIEDIIR